MELTYKKYVTGKWLEKLQMWVAYKMPRWLVYWASVRLMSYATTGKFATTVVPELTAMDALKRWKE